MGQAQHAADPSTWVGLLKLLSAQSDTNPAGNGGLEGLTPFLVWERMETHIFESRRNIT